MVVAAEVVALVVAAAVVAGTKAITRRHIYLPAREKKRPRTETKCATRTERILDNNV